MEGYSMIPSEWIKEIIERELDASSSSRLTEAISGIDASVFESQDLDRIVAAMVILLREGVDLEVIIDEAVSDWRDLLVDAGLGGGDWPTVIADRFGPHPGSQIHG
ncbi:hypothetical protein [Kitasatospora sp. MMS16-BH015]|uniref:hypothetical protein n=1 Tax=Kitasatospora sp. MMS16-BH015 TaxID=2018025 RepID=UPI00131A5314|nr:hypothetical protein [Kitasatospora sp. MMS16-BH015]